MSHSQDIRAALAGVQALREGCRADAPLHAALTRIKALQAQRFAATYRDLLQPQDASGQIYADAARFFLTELYSPGDYTERDAQFARMAGAIDTLLPERTVAVMRTLAHLHLLTETLDLAMARAWLAQGTGPAHAAAADARRYVAAWRVVDQPAQRQDQLATVLGVGVELARLTRATGLRTLLRMMRRPAQAAGLAALQHFLETGFDTFGAMNRAPGGVQGFLDLIAQREQALLDLMAGGDRVACETHWSSQLGLAPTG